MDQESSQRTCKEGIWCCFSHQHDGDYLRLLGFVPQKFKKKAFIHSPEKIKMWLVEKSIHGFKSGLMKKMSSYNGTMNRGQEIKLNEIKK